MCSDCPGGFISITEQVDRSGRGSSYGVVVYGVLIYLTMNLLTFILTFMFTYLLTSLTLYVSYFDNKDVVLVSFGLLKVN